MGDHHQRRSQFPVEFEHQRHHLLAGRVVEAAGRLVREQQRRLLHEGPRQRHALLLAARQHPRIVRQPLPQPDALEHLPGLRAGIALTAQLQRQHHVLQRRQVGQQLEALEHEAQVRAAQRGAAVLVEREHVLPTQPHRAFGRRVQAREDGQQRALARARGADDGDRLPGLQLEIDVMQNGQHAVGILDRLADVIDFEDVLSHESTADAPP